MGDEQKGYQPSPEEIQNAENMIPDESRQTDRERELAYNAGMKAEREKIIQEPEAKEKEGSILERAAGIYAEMYGEDAGQILEKLRAKQATLSEQERGVYKLPIYVPEKFSTASAWRMVKKENIVHEFIDPAKITTEGETEEAVVAFARQSKDPDADSLGDNAKSAEEWEKTGQKFMSPRQRMIAGVLFSRLTGRQMDEENLTLCPGSRDVSGFVPCFDFFSAYGRVNLNSSPLINRNPDLGVRRVV